MIKKFIIRNKSMNTSLELELTKPGLTGIYVKEVTGLGYPSSNISITNIVTSDIGHFNQSIFESRNVVFTFGFIPNAEVEINRNKLYQVFVPKTFIRVDIYTDSSEKMRYFEGQVETCEPNIFSKEENIQISLICPNPYLIGDTPKELIFIGSKLSFYTNRQVEQEYQIELDYKDGIDNVKIEYYGGSILYGSFDIIDPYNPGVNEESNSIKPSEKLLITTDVNDYGIYIVNTSNEKREITQNCFINGNYPVLLAGKNVINVFANGIVVNENPGTTKKETIGTWKWFYYLVKEMSEYTVETDKILVWGMRGSTGNADVSLDDQATSMTIYVYDRDMEYDNSAKDIEKMIGTITVNEMPKRTSAIDSSDSRNTLELFVTLDSNDNVKSVNLGRHYYNNGQYGDYVIFDNVSEEMNSLYKGKKEIKKGLVYSIYEYKTHGTSGKCYQTVDVTIPSGDKSYEFKDISSNITTKITYPDYYSGL